VQTETGSPGVGHRFGQKFSDIFEFVEKQYNGNMELLSSTLASKTSIWPPVFESLGSWIDKSLEEFSNGRQVQSRLVRNPPNNRNVFVHEASGGGFKSFQILEHLTLTTKLLEQIADSAKAIPSGSTAMHFRNSDYRSNYDSLRGSIESLSPTVPVLLASDDETVLISLKRDLPDRQFVSSPSLNAKRTTLTHTEVAVHELVLVSGVKSLVLQPLDYLGRKDPIYSGFGLLAQHLWMVRRIQARGLIEYLRQLYFLAVSKQVRRPYILRLGFVFFIQAPMLFRQAFYPKGLYRQLADIDSKSNRGPKD
jgi:hypothetical protein